MGKVPADAAAKPPVAMPHVQEPPPGLTRARWLYVDEALSHEVHAGVRPGKDGPELVVREAAYGNVDPAEVVESVIPLREAWDAQFHHLELETRLALLGRYWRHDAQKPGWTRVRSPAPGESADLREVDVGPLFPGDATFWHFHPPEGRRAAVLLRLPHWHPAGLRFLVARAELEYPDARRADLRLLHGRLALTPMRSVLLREHREQARRGARKLVGPDDFRLAHGDGWQVPLLTCYRDLLDRVARGQWGRPAEDAAPAVPLDDPYTDYVRWLNDPRVAALHARFLTPEEEAALMSGGEEFIRQAIARKRARAAARDQHLLGILEASLLARDGLRQGGHKVDPEVAALVRRFSFYL